MTGSGAAALLRVDDLRVSFTGAAGQRLEILRGISFSLDRQSSIGIVGESGSGKSVMALSLLRLIPRPPLQQMTGYIHFVPVPQIRPTLVPVLEHKTGIQISVFFLSDFKKIDYPVAFLF